MTQQGATVEVLVEDGGKRASLGPPLSACKVPGVYARHNAAAQKLGDVLEGGKPRGIVDKLLQARAR